MLPSNWMRYWCVSPIRPWAGINSSWSKMQSLNQTQKLCGGHCIIWNVVHLPASDMLWLSKERLEYFVNISSWMGRLVKGEAVRKRSGDYILLSRWSNTLLIFPHHCHWLIWQHLSFPCLKVSRDLLNAETFEWTYQQELMKTYEHLPIKMNLSFFSGVPLLERLP